ncbi:pyridoxal-phosphate dependent enzyme, partial [candidate division WOR-3 bacterium]|nr:pyridoxal-phosphate dependent enzyme [candidate division WOR-3 bacterium]
KVTIFMPKTAPRAKMVQSLQYGAEVIQVDGDYNRAYDLSLEYIKNKGGLNRNTAYNPLTIEGKKTVAIEIYQQLNKAPDFVFVPVGDGVILGGVYKGFRDLLKLGLIDKIPVIYAVQAEGSSAIYRAFKKGEFNQPKESMTIADSISVDVPRNGYYVLKLLKKYNGRCITVPDEDILKAQKELASSAGLFSEPAASASLAGFLKVKNEIKKDSTVVLLITGNGLKDIDAAMRGLRLFDKLNR